MIATDEAHLWWAGLDLAPPVRTALAGLLSADEQQRAERLIIPIARERFTVARALLRTVLADYTGAAAQRLAFTYGPHGKPELRVNPGELRFSVSHAEHLFVVAVARQCAVGVDLERVRHLPELPMMAELIGTPSERETLDRLPEARRVEAFLRIWTTKEAISKASGLGLAGVMGKYGDPAALGGWSIEQLVAPQGFIATLATARPGLRLVHRTLADAPFAE